MKENKNFLPLLVSRPTTIFFELIFFGNIFISLCAASLVQLTYLQVGLKPALDAATVFVFGSTLFIYSLHRLLVIKQTSDDEKGAIRSWAKKNAFFLVMFLISGAGIFSLAVFHLQFTSVVLLAVLGIISMLYELPLIPFRGKMLKLRNIGISKPVMLILVWVVSTAMIPCIEKNISLLDFRVPLIFIERIILILFIVLSFDLRDIEFDKREGVKTIPVLLGEEKIKKLYIVLLVIGILTSILHYAILIHATDLLAARIINLLITYYIVSNKKWKRSEMYFAFFVDGCLLFQFLLTWFATLLF